MSAPGRPVHGPFVTRYDRVVLPVDITLTEANLRAVMAIYRGKAGTGGWQQRHAALMADKIDAHLRGGPRLDTGISLPLQVWRLGTDLRIAVTGGELVAGYGLWFRRRFGGAEKLIIGGYAGEVPCYIPSEEILRTTYYEAGRDPAHPGIAGESMALYGQGPGHFLANSPGREDGVEPTLIRALTAMLG